MSTPSTPKNQEIKQDDSDLIKVEKEGEGKIVEKKGQEQVEDDGYIEVEATTSGLLLGIIQQIRMGIEMSKVIIPCEFLEPRSLLERLSDMMSHIDYCLEGYDTESSEERMLIVLRWYLSSWYIRPKGVKKPYNPVLGEVFKCNFEYKKDKKFTYFAEQVRHHPPISAFFVEDQTTKTYAEGYYAPTSHFMGNSGSSTTEGIMRCTIPKFNQTYIMTWPDVYFRGLIFGGLFMELNKTTTIKCDESKYECTINFKPKPMVGGEVNEVEAKMKGPDGKILYIITGKWDGILYIRKKTDKEKDKKIFLDTTKQTKLPKKIQKLEKQKDYESQVIWKDLTYAIRKGDIAAASKAKALIEQTQREKRKQFEETGATYKPRFFKPSEKYEKEWEFIGHDDPEYLMVLGDLE